MPVENHFIQRTGQLTDKLRFSKIVKVLGNEVDLLGHSVVVEGFENGDKFFV